MSKAPVNILDTIVEQKRREVALLPPATITEDTIRSALQNRRGTRDFAKALTCARRPGPALIAEIKKSSPSAGLICADFDPVRIAREYERAGATCLSVLTDEKFFQGSLHYLCQIREAVTLPLLRKDFVIDDRQILEAAQWGADAVLLIVAILTDDELSRFRTLAERAGMAALVEVHDEQELRRALNSGATLLGVNNRNLRTFKVDLGTTEHLSRLLPTDNRPFLVAESGIHTMADARRVAEAGAGAILVGESLMRSGNIAQQVETLLPA